LLQAAMGLIFALTGARWLGPSENGMAILLMGMGLLLAAAGLVLAGLAWRIAWLRGPALELTEEGLRDRRLSPDVIPWDAISWRVMFNGRSYSLQFDVAEAQRKILRIYWPHRAMALFNRLMRHPEFTVVTLGTGLTAEAIGARMNSFKTRIS
ncbi:hypothetical protein, partial [Aestuariivirga sp.]|uniref:hypothetical protein n=1 Tax=Aestuariivirga sp. TaxID=2650926 RepID=UPI00391C4444